MELDNGTTFLYEENMTTFLYKENMAGIGWNYFDLNQSCPMFEKSGSTQLSKNHN